MKTYSRSTCQHDYEVYRDDENVSPLARLLSWTLNLIILNQSKRELERQFKAARFERTVLNPPKVSPLVSQMHPNALGIFKDSYLVEFLCLPQAHAEADLHQGLLQAKLHEFYLQTEPDDDAAK